MITIWIPVTKDDMMHSLEKELTGEAIGTMRRGIVNGANGNGSSKVASK